MTYGVKGNYLELYFEVNTTDYLNSQLKFSNGQYITEDGQLEKAACVWNKLQTASSLH